MKTSEIDKAYKSDKAKVCFLLLGFIGLILIFILSLSLGAAQISFFDVIGMSFSSNAYDEGIKNIFFLVRLPRSLAALLAGAALSVSGGVLQAVLRNPMCSPSIIGVNAGAGLFMTAVSALLPGYIFLAPIAAFAGALAAVLTVYLTARHTGASKTSIVLAGLAVSGLLSAITDVILTLVPEAKASRVEFMIGSFSGVTSSSVKAAAIYILLGIFVLLFFSTDLNVLSLGDSTAASLGMRVGATRGLFLIISALLAGAAISLCGLVSFVGLLVPHICRRFVGSDSRFLIPFCAIIGGGFCLLCDTLSRVLFAPFELPVGIIMSILGGLFFIFLILRKRKPGMKGGYLQ